MTAVRTALRDEQDFAEALDRWSPDLLGLALAFADDARTAHRMVEVGWLRALRQGQLDAPTGGVRTAVVRAMTETCDTERDPALTAAQRALRLAVRGTGVLVLPGQRDRRRPSAFAPAAPSVLQLGDLRRVAPSLRLVLLLTDVQRWPTGEVEELLEVRPEAHRAILSHARRALLSNLPRSASA